MQNKPKVKIGKMNVSAVKTMNYELRTTNNELRTMNNELRTMNYTLYAIRSTQHAIRSTLYEASAFRLLYSVVCPLSSVFCPLHLSRELYKSPLFMQNKPKVKIGKMNVNYYITKDYENKSNWTLVKSGKNKPKQSQTKPKSK